jgi:general secretion pathway protein J
MSRASAECGVRIADFGSKPTAIGLTSHSVLRTSQSKGFTLLEVLLALAILAMIVTAIYSSFSTAGRNIESAETIRDGTDLARTLIARLANDIANVYVNGNLNETFFYGSKLERDEDKQRFDSIYLTTLTNQRYLSQKSDANSKEMDLWEVGYFFQDKPDGKGKVLMRKEKREISKDMPRREGGIDYELTDTVEGLRLRYSNGATWADEWNQSGLPKAVEIVLTLADGRVYATEVDIRQIQ